jgi:conjugal transfer pilus assembly protein TraU
MTLPPWVRALHAGCTSVRRGAAGVLWALLCGGAAAQSDAGGPGQATCFGQFMNPISDVCWTCIFPISIGAFSIDYGQEDIENPPIPICICPGLPIRVGLEVGFWEPARTVEVTRTPFCFPTLGGVYFNGGSAPLGGHDFTTDTKVSRGSFYQVHYYVNPLLYILEVLLDNACVESGAWDLAYMTEYDPTWHDDELTAILEPEAPLFANIIAIAACSADCIAASIGFGFQVMFWCSGCNGGVYPMNGNLPVHYGGAQASSLLVHRMLAKLHRQLIAWRWHGADAVCAPVFDPIMDKRGYKIQMVYPIPYTFGFDGSAGVNRCCQPLGRTTLLWGIGREYPIRGEDFAYQIFRKRNCCMF